MNVSEQSIKLKVIVHGDAVMREMDVQPALTVQQNVDNMVRSVVDTNP
jgi:hypothetical protein